jgi:geranylgeranyl pyrophosphate synthase
MLADAPESEIQKLIDLGRRVGIAFQIIDDVLGVFGDDKETGKTTDGDIRERKHTILIQEAYQRLQGEDHETLLSLYDVSHDMTDEDVNTVRQLLIKSGARAAVEAEAMRLTEEARDIVSSLTIEQPARDAFLALIDMLATRRS